MARSLGDKLSALPAARREAIEAEAEALLREDEERKAMKLFKKILGKRYTGTETAKRVRERFPDLE